jgi:sec-independent protein translocase protein TatA
MTPLFALPFLSPQDIIILLVIGVLLFGRKLPEVGKYLGKGIVEFKKGLKGIEDEVDNSSQQRQTTQQQSDAVQIEQPRVPQRVATVAPKFEDVPANTQVSANTTEKK